MQNESVPFTRQARLDQLNNLLEAVIAAYARRRDPSATMGMTTLLDPERRLYGRVVVEDEAPSIALATNGGLYRNQGGTFVPLAVREIVALRPPVSQKLLAGMQSH